MKTVMFDCFRPVIFGLYYGVIEEIVLTWEITQGYSCELEVLVLVGKTLSHPESIREVQIP